MEFDKNNKNDIAFLFKQIKSQILVSENSSDNVIYVPDFENKTERVFIKVID